jgi:hypothetical protein
MIDIKKTAVTAKGRSSYRQNQISSSKQVSSVKYSDDVLSRLSSLEAKLAALEAKLGG